MTGSLTYHFLVAILPLIFSGTLHMVLIKKDLFPSTRIPISEKLFGANKTWRGVFFMTLVNGLLLLLIKSIFKLEIETAFGLGAALGFAYALFELPNSYVKRRLGIQPGGDSKKHKYLFRIMDRLDSSLGVALVYYIYSSFDLLAGLSVLVLGVFIHLLISFLLVKLNIKKSL